MFSNYNINCWQFVPVEHSACCTFSEKSLQKCNKKTILHFNLWNNKPVEGISYKLKQRSCQGVHTRRSFILNLLSQLFTKCLYFKSVFSPALKIMIFQEISKEHSSNIHKGFCPVFFSMHNFLYKKTIFCVSLNFLNIILEIFWDFFNISLNFYLFIFFNCLLS